MPFLTSRLLACVCVCVVVVAGRRDASRGFQPPALEVPPPLRTLVVTLVWFCAHAPPAAAGERPPDHGRCHPPPGQRSSLHPGGVPACRRRLPTVFPGRVCAANLPPSLPPSLPLPQLADRFDGTPFDPLPAPARVILLEELHSEDWAGGERPRSPRAPAPITCPNYVLQSPAPITCPNHLPQLRAHHPRRSLPPRSCQAGQRAAATAACANHASLSDVAAAPPAAARRLLQTKAAPQAPAAPTPWSTCCRASSEAWPRPRCTSERRVLGQGQGGGTAAPACRR